MAESTIGFGLQPGYMKCPQGGRLGAVTSKGYESFCPAGSSGTRHLQVSGIFLPLLASCSHQRHWSWQILTVGYEGLNSHFFVVRGFPADSRTILALNSCGGWGGLRPSNICPKS